ncbi:uncharacterized protein LOC125673406 [Ostrea edulis]|uniref:uncharacterized protein LOC125673406 n=1 Tax=Ostrea edulis TaxID=37623 RepID=UPI0024AF079F|nr:uncharacterized protein LOC125673406 [Ostrea edulis]
MNFSICLLVTLFVGTVAYRARGKEFFKEKEGVMQNEKPLWKELLQKRGVIHFIKTSNDEEDDANKMIPVTDELFIFRQEGETAVTREDPNPKEEAEKNSPPPGGPSHVDNSEGEIQGPERNPVRKVKYRPRQGRNFMTAGRKKILARDFNSAIFRVGGSNWSP